MLHVKEQVVGSYILHGADVACAHAHDALIRFVDKVYMTAVHVYVYICACVCVCVHVYVHAHVLITLVFV